MAYAKDALMQKSERTSNKLADTKVELVMLTKTDLTTPQMYLMCLTTPQNVKVFSSLTRSFVLISNSNQYKHGSRNVWNGIPLVRIFIPTGTPVHIIPCMGLPPWCLRHYIIPSMGLQFAPWCLRHYRYRYTCPHHPMYGVPPWRLRHHNADDTYLVHACHALLHRTLQTAPKRLPNKHGANKVQAVPLLIQTSG